jgi:hypothetical protein
VIRVTATANSAQFCANSAQYRFALIFSRNQCIVLCRNEGFMNRLFASFFANATPKRATLPLQLGTPGAPPGL